VVEVDASGNVIGDTGLDSDGEERKVAIMDEDEGYSDEETGQELT